MVLQLESHNELLHSLTGHEYNLAICDLHVCMHPLACTRARAYICIGEVKSARYG